MDQKMISAANVSRTKTDAVSILYIVLRVIVVFAFVAMFIPSFNPGKVATEINKYLSLFSSVFSYDTLTNSYARLITSGRLAPGGFYLIMASAAVAVLGVLAMCAGGCLTLGNKRCKKMSYIFLGAGGLALLLGLGGFIGAYSMFSAPDISGIEAQIPGGFYLFAAIGVVVLGLSASVYLLSKEWKVKPVKREEMRIPEKYMLFLYLLPVVLLTGLFSYLPLFGWGYAFFDYLPGQSLTMDYFVGFKWFAEFFSNPTRNAELLRVLRNTLIMSGLGILTSFLPVAFAVFYAEIKNKGLRKFIQIASTLPYFISWVLVYAFALAMFSSEGLLNNLIGALTGTTHSKNYLAISTATWLQMLAWGTWKGLGWSAIIYIAAVAGIDQQLYEAASIDGATRFKKMWYITVPALMPTFSVMLLMSFAGILSNGLEQYLVFENANNHDQITVLDLYVYTLGLGTTSGSDPQIPLSTVIGMAKSIISILLLFLANWTSKRIRGESIF